MDLCLGILGELSLLKRCDNNHSVHIAPPSSVLSLTRLLTSYVCPLMNHLFILVLLSLCMSARINTSSSPQCIQSFYLFIAPPVWRLIQVWLFLSVQADVSYLSIIFIFIFIPSVARSQSSPAGSVCHSSHREFSSLLASLRVLLIRSCGEEVEKSSLPRSRSLSVRYRSKDHEFYCFIKIFLVTYI